MTVIEHMGAGSLVEATSRLSSGGILLGVMLVVGGIPVAAVLLIGVLRNFFARS
jgi:hypothetical protein